MILTTDVKKRVWHRARIGVLGEATPIFVYDVSNLGVASVQVVNWRLMLETLEFVETIYTMGFTKNNIRDSLLRQFTLTQKIGVREAIRLDKQLKPLRETPEFAVAVIIAQKENENEHCETKY